MSTRKQPPRKPAMKFPQLRKKLNQRKALQQRKVPVQNVRRRANPK